MNKLNLKYENKISETELLVEARNTEPVQFQVEKAYFNQLSAESNWKNLIVRGDNLDFLKIIFADKDDWTSGKIKGKVKLIYIDPPFGTGMEYNGNRGQIGYSAKKQGPEFVEFIRQRLIFAREILSDDGFIFVRQAYNFGHYIKIILDEVFGYDNFKNEIIISRKRQSMGTNGKFETQNESLFIYSKNLSSKLNTIYTKRALTNFKWSGFLKQENRYPRERIFFGKTFTPPDNQHFSLIQSKVDKLQNEHYLRVKCTDCGAIYYYDEKNSGEYFIRSIRGKNTFAFKYLDITSESIIYGVKQIDRCLSCGKNNFKVEYLPSDDMKLNNIWLDIPSYSDNSGYPTENSEELLYRVVEAATKEGDLVIDFFGGSGTTAIVAEKLNRRWVYCDSGKLAFCSFLKRLLKIKESKNLENSKSTYGNDPNDFLVLKQKKMESDNTIDNKFALNFPPVVEYEIKKENGKNNLLIKKFEPTDKFQKQSLFKDGMQKLSFILVDDEYDKKIFVIRQVIDAGLLNKKSNNKCPQIQLTNNKNKAAVISYDIFGNEVEINIATL